MTPTRTHPRLRMFHLCPLCASPKAIGVTTCFACLYRCDLDEFAGILDSAEHALLRVARANGAKPPPAPIGNHFFIAVAEEGRP
jgi:hypothetical protein